jgi:hypothetical protein
VPTTRCGPGRNGAWQAVQPPTLGNFAYYTAGDLTSYTYDGEQPWRDALTAAARAAGPVDVATADHHGLFDGLSADTVRTLRPQAWVIPGWHISHPDLLQLERMFSKCLYPGPRDVFATTVMEANLMANHRPARRMRSTDGHVVVRVAPDGAQPGRAGPGQTGDGTVRQRPEKRQGLNTG